MGNFDSFNRDKNSYFNFKGDGYKRDKDMLSGLVTQAFNMHGVCQEFYITSYNKSYNPIYGEDCNRRFIRNFDFMSYFSLPKENKLFSKFGIQGISDNFSMYVSKKHFRVASSQNGGVEHIPKMGDIIRSKYNNKFYEITEIIEDVYVWLHSKQHVWEFVVNIYKDEGIKTTDATSASAISEFTDKDKDVFDLKNDIDTEIEKDKIKYNPPAEEKNNEDPWGNY